MRTRPIRHNSWRYKFAQWILTRLYGRKWHFISPWQGSGQSAAICFFYKKKLLMALRGGNIEAAGKWWIIGGYCDLHDNESIYKTVVREAWEEVGLKLPEDTFGPDDIFSYMQIFNKTMLELDNECHNCLFFTYELSKAQFEQLKPLEETERLELFTHDQVVKMVTTGEVTVPFLETVVNKAKKLGLID